MESIEWLEGCPPQTQADPTPARTPHGMYGDPAATRQSLHSEHSPKNSTS